MFNITWDNVIITFSGYKQFLRCPYSWYLSYIKELELKPEFYNTAMLRGKAIHEIILEQKTDSYKYLSDTDKAGIKALYRYMKETGIIDYLKQFRTELEAKKVIYKTKKKQVIFQGTIDGLKEDYAIELKYTSKARDYDNNWNYKVQLAFYFYLLPQIEVFNLIPIQVPQLKQKKDEDIEKYENRIYEDIARRPKYYLPYLDITDVYIHLGIKYYRHEFKPMFNEIEIQLKFIGKLLSDMIKRNQFPKSYYWCEMCQFKYICETGVISEELYQKRTELR